MTEPGLRVIPARASQRSTLLALGVLATLAIAPLFTHHMIPPVTTGGHGHFVSLCLVALHTLLSPVHGVFHLMFLSGIAYAVWDRTRAWHLGRGTLSAALWRVPTPGDVFWNAAVRAGVSPRSVRILVESPTPAFTMGWWRPTMYVSEAAAIYFDEDQLAAVLEHEHTHVRHRDPLRLSLLRFLSCMLYWLPMIRRLASDLADEFELLADQSSTRPAVLASAIVESARYRWCRALPGTASLHGTDFIDRRVRRLLGETPPPRTHVTHLSLAGAAGVLALLMTSAVVVAHPKPGHAADHARHCDDHENAFVHLFCMFGHDDRTDECPHGPTAARAV